MKPILEIKGLSKKYRIEGNRQPYLSLREQLFSFLGPRSVKKEFWALRDIEFELEPGDCLGVIGRNGAGKSTLLKILSKITPPTSGRVISRGRIASLLEVGTGFHPELSGRENVFMNGSILGMKRAEIRKHFDQIVEFSGVEQFLETPLKHYSSGMQLRLAFAVAAFLEPEILVIDEVLAVGDAEFQKKCLNKMEDVSRSGRTVLFVSHQLSAIDALCNKGIVLDAGRLLFRGSARESLEFYNGGRLQRNAAERAAANEMLSQICVNSLEHGNTIEAFDTIVIEGDIRLKEPLKNPTLGLVVRNSYNIPVLGINNRHYGKGFDTLSNGHFKVTLRNAPLLPGYYSMDVFLGSGSSDIHHLQNAAEFEINERNIFTGGKNPEQKFNSFLLKDVQWQLMPV